MDGVKSGAKSENMEMRSSRTLWGVFMFGCSAAYLEGVTESESWIAGCSPDHEGFENTTNNSNF